LKGNPTDFSQPLPRCHCWCQQNRKDASQVFFFLYVYVQYNQIAVLNIHVGPSIFRPFYPTFLLDFLSGVCGRRGMGYLVVSMSSMLYVCILSTKCHLNPSHSVCSTPVPIRHPSLSVLRPWSLVLAAAALSYPCSCLFGCVAGCVFSLLRFEYSYDYTHTRVYKYSRLRDSLGERGDPLRLHWQ